MIFRYGDDMRDIVSFPMYFQVITGILLGTALGYVVIVVSFIIAHNKLYKVIDERMNCSSSFELNDEFKYYNYLSIVFVIYPLIIVIF